MRNWIIAAAAIPVLALIFTYGNHDSAAGHMADFLFGIFLCLPVVGTVYVFVKFAKWHRSFHQRMKKGIYAK